MATPNINNNNKVQAADLHSFNAGMKKADAKNSAQKSVFDALDKNKDGVLSQSELSGIVKGKVKNTKGQLVEKEYIKLKDLGNGRSLVIDQNGKQWVRAHDGVILKQSYVDNSNQKSKAVPDKNALKTANFLAKEYNSASKAFNAQMEKDGWAGDLADGISRAWTWATDSKNSANYVRQDLKDSKKNVQDLQKAAKQGQAQFNAKFKEIYGVNYNQQAMDAYMADPSEVNYQKAFGSKTKNIKTRVDNYNQSQETGAVAVKTTAKVGAGIAIGVATGGTGFVALGAAAAATAAASVAIEETDAMKVTKAVTEGKVEFREGTDHTKILKDAAWDGASVLAGGAVGKAAGAVIKGTSKMAVAGRTATNVAGDVAMGAAQEYAETGQVTATGVATNAVMSGVGSAVTSGVLNKAKDVIGNAFKGKAPDVEVPKAQVNPKTSTVTSETHTVSHSQVDTDLPKTGAMKSASANTSKTTVDAPTLNEPTTILEGNRAVAADVNEQMGAPRASRPVEVDMNEQMAPPRATASRATQKTTIPMNQQIQIGDNITVLRQTTSYGTIVIDGKPKTMYVKRGETVTYKDAAGNSIIAKQDLNGNLTIETTSSTPSGRTNSTGKTWNVSINESGVKIAKDKSLSLKGESCVYHSTEGRATLHKLKPGESKIIDNINGNPITLTRGIDGKYKVTNAAPQQPKIVSGNTSAKPAVDLPKMEDLTAMRRNSPNAYNHLAREELEKLGATKGKKGLCQFIRNAREDAPTAAMSENLLHAIQLENQGRTLVTNLDKSVDLSQISKHVDNGGVFSHNGKLYVNDAGQSVELNLSQEKFEELFPPVQSAFFTQGYLGDCWFVSCLSAQMDVPKGRVELYKRFKQSGDDIIVTSSGKADVVFKGGKCLDAPGIERGYAKGLRMIEQTTAVHRTSKGTLDVKSGKIDITEAASIASNPSKLMKRLEGGFQSEGFGLLGDFKISSMNEMKFHETLSSSQLAEMKDKIVEIANDSNIAVGFVKQTDKNHKLGLYEYTHGRLIQNHHAMKIVGCHNGYVEYVNQNYSTSNILRMKLDEFIDKHLSSLTWTDFSPGIPTPQGNFNKIIL